MTPASPQADPSALRPRTRVIALINQKGGVGKTTTTVNLGAALSRLGQRVLLIDLDPQAHLTLHVGVDPDALDLSVYDLLASDDVTAAQVLRQVTDTLAVIPAEVNLAGVEMELAARAASGAAQRILADKLDVLLGSHEPPFDFVLMDCPPSLGLLTIGALAAATEVIVPMQAHFLALQGLSKLLETVALVRQSLNPMLTVAGVLPCMHESQTLLASEVMADLRTFFDAARSLDVPWRSAQILGPSIRRNIKLAECPSFGKTIFDYAPDCNGARDYQQLARRVFELAPTKHGLPPVGQPAAAEPVAEPATATA